MLVVLNNTLKTHGAMNYKKGTNGSLVPVTEQSVQITNAI